MSSSWRNPEEESTPVSGYNLFQRLNTNDSGEIATTGSNIVEKYFNPQTIDIIYREFIPPDFRYLYTALGQDSYRIINAVDPVKNETHVLSSHTESLGNQDITMAWNNVDDWFVIRSGATIFHSENGGESWTSPGGLGGNLYHSIPAVLHNIPYFVNRTENKVYKWLNGAFVETSGQPDTSDISLGQWDETNNIVLRSIFVNDEKLYAVGLGDAAGFSPVKRTVLYMSDDEGATWTRTRVFVIEDNDGNWYEFEDYNGGVLYNFKPLGNNKIFITGDSNTEQSNYLLPTFSGSLDTVDTETTYLMLDDTLANQPINPTTGQSGLYINPFYDGKVIVQGAGGDTGFVPVLKVITGTSETDYSATINSLYSGGAIEWEALYCAFKDNDTIIFSFDVFDDGTGTSIRETYELNLTSSELTFITDDDYRKHFQVY